MPVGAPFEKFVAEKGRKALPGFFKALSAPAEFSFARKNSKPVLARLHGARIETKFGAHKDYFVCAEELGERSG